MSVQLNESQAKVFYDRYALRDQDGNLVEQTVEEMWRRVANAVAQAENEDSRAYWADRFYEILSDFRFVPGGRILHGAGNPANVTLFNCFVLPRPRDSWEGIDETLHRMTLLMKAGGGVGIDLATLRPKGAMVRSVNGRSSGAVSLGEIYSQRTGQIQQGGSRRGALMISLPVWHPDIEEFITIKRELDKNGNSVHYTYANISVRVSDAFMKAVEEDADWDLIFPDTTHPAYETEWDGEIEDWIAKGYPVIKYKTVKARKLLRMIVENNWAAAEPGIIYWDTVRRHHNAEYFNKVISTNPCAEQTLPGNSLCLLGHINLSKYVGKDGQVAWTWLAHDVGVAVRFLDDVIDISKYPLEANREIEMRERRIGLGTMGLAHMLIKLGLRYGSDEAAAFADRLYRFIAKHAYLASIELAKEKGTFPAFDYDGYTKSTFVTRMMQEFPEIAEGIKNYGIRNVTLLTQAPTGTGSLLANTSSGIEPVYRFVIRRSDRLGERVIEDAVYSEYVKSGKVDPNNLPPYFVTAKDVTPLEHIKMMAIIQRWVDASISKTVNVPEHTTVEELEQLYLYAWKQGVKSFTIFRDNSRAHVIADATDEKAKMYKDEDSASAKVTQKRNEPPILPRPRAMRGYAYVVPTPFGNVTVDIHVDDNEEPIEVFVSTGAVGSDIMADGVALGMVISTALRLNSPVSRSQRLQMIADKLRDIGRKPSLSKERAATIPAAVAKAIDKFFARSQTTSQAQTEQVTVTPILKLGIVPEQSTHDDKDFCPQCGNATLVHEGGCYTCINCNFSKCG